MKTIIEIILYIVYRNIGHDGAFTVLLLRAWVKYALKSQGYDVSNLNLAYEFGNRYQGTLDYTENGKEMHLSFQIIYDGVNIQVAGLEATPLTPEEDNESIN